MIGNDIIDLQFALSESIVLQQRRLDKICTLAEQRYIRQAENSWQTFWLIWTRKEACYKAFQRDNYIHSICPHQIENQFDSSGMLSESISFRGKQFFAQTAIDGSKIHSICSSSEERLKEIHVLDDLQEVLYLFDFRKDTNGMPFLQTKNNHRRIPISKSSHGAFTTYALFKADIANLDATALIYA
ncbi:4'-phosphopantetheinyl transferase superfamily protein [Flavobacterium sp.]|uniref:4'-phosphopantetheinyl transferase family protein n=1 Tax=Flavobacterium sp. TaxID=239 RepID=UPI0026251841|nr:4'-phosphopantetheinyl transferase superfamily protein [Flavobacterium sp.]